MDYLFFLKALHFKRGFKIIGSSTIEYYDKKTGNLKVVSYKIDWKRRYQNQFKFTNVKSFSITGKTKNKQTCNIKE